MRGCEPGRYLGSRPSGQGEQRPQVGQHQCGGGEGREGERSGKEMGDVMEASQEGPHRP